MKKKKFLLLAFTMLCALFVATACFERDSEHIHTFGGWVPVTQPTCQAEGLRRQTCSCGEVREEPLPRTEHSYKYGICTDCGNLQPGAEQFTLETLFTQNHKENFAVVWNDMFQIFSVKEFDSATQIYTFSPEELENIERTYQVKLTSLRSLRTPLSPSL